MATRTDPFMERNGFIIPQQFLKLCLIAWNRHRAVDFEDRQWEDSENWLTLLLQFKFLIAHQTSDSSVSREHRSWQSSPRTSVPGPDWGTIRYRMLRQSASSKRRGQYFFLHWPDTEASSALCRAALTWYCRMADLCYSCMVVLKLCLV